MHTLELINKTREYLDYVEEHVKNVSKAWKELQLKCKDMRFIYDDFYYNWIGSDVENHDFSKLSEHEFVQYRKYFYPCRWDETSNDAICAEFKLAWEHHKRNNPHHWESWTTKDHFHPNEWEVHCVHMVIDWMAMSYKFGDTAKEYYENNKESIKIPQYAIDFIYEIFDRIE